MSKRALGRGLEALIFDSSDEKGIKEISLTEIETNIDQPRKEFNIDSLEELAESIRIHGLLQPILVRINGQKYTIIAGERRFRAAKMAGLEKIACLVQECSPQESAERALVENIQRSDLSPIDEGLAYVRLMEDYGLTQEQVAGRVGKGRPTVANLIRVIKLPEPILSLLRQERITVGHAKLLLSIDDSSLQIMIAKKVSKDGLSVREAENLIGNLFDKEDTKTKEIKKVTISENSTMQVVEERLNSFLQTKVKLKGKPGKGKIIIDYFSQEELNRLLELWNIPIE
ncbi:MAG: ParB/RepB/Spo0J family partition protein [Desulfitobacteriaceae bacterium]|nr:ParB/RepB/Spo0J family partition protein [Desulfitobacteriaceae bacterium]MDD4345350.1 ParB/RepB/Spo0J family partition protein [Desulfitobacteriaceae bacterium]MDD4400327.1 ParB/RepB/Spo0J family partition protein [Desulfitobacteriaceae bacterium]